MESDSVCNHTNDHEIAGVRFVNYEYDYRPTSDETKSHYQLIIKYYNLQGLIIVNDVIRWFEFRMAQPTVPLQLFDYM